MGRNTLLLAGCHRPTGHGALPHHYPDSILPGRLESSFVPQNIPAPQWAASLQACEEATEGYGGYRSPSASAKSAVKVGQITKTF